MTRNFLYHLSKRFKVFANWYELELMYAGFEKINGHKIKTRNGLNFLVRTKNDLNVLEEVFVNQVYNQKPVEVPLGGTIVDIGAHFGAFSLYAATLCKANKVYSFEPCPNNFQSLKRNLENNSFNNIITSIPKAITAKSCKRNLFVCSDNNGGHTLYCNAKNEPFVEVECTTLRQALEENNIDHVDFLKIDCEGAEWEILKSMEQETAAKIDNICLEYHFRPRDDFLIELRSRGFTVFDYEDSEKNGRYIKATYFASK